MSSQLFFFNLKTILNPLNVHLQQMYNRDQLLKRKNGRKLAFDILNETKEKEAASYKLFCVQLAKETTFNLLRMTIFLPFKNANNDGSLQLPF